MRNDRFGNKEKRRQDHYFLELEANWIKMSWRRKDILSLKRKRLNLEWTRVPYWDLERLLHLNRKERRWKQSIGTNMGNWETCGYWSWSYTWYFAGLHWWAVQKILNWSVVKYLTNQKEEIRNFRNMKKL